MRYSKVSVLILLSFLLISNRDLSCGTSEREIKGKILSEIPTPDPNAPFTVSVPTRVNYYEERQFLSVSFTSEFFVKDALAAIEFPKNVETIYKPANDAEKSDHLSLGYWKLEPDHKYKIKIKKFKNIFGKDLVNPGDFEIYIPNRFGYFSVSTNGVVIEALKEQNLPVFVKNLPELDVGVAEVSIQDILKIRPTRTDYYYN